LKHPRRYLWDLLLTRLYVGVPVLTDTMLIDTRAMREVARDPVCSNVFGQLVGTGNLIGLRRGRAGSFKEAAGVMVKAGMKFSSLDKDRGDSLKASVERNPGMSTEEAYHLLLAVLADNGEKEAADYFQLLDRSALSIENWPTIEVPYPKAVFTNLEQCWLLNPQRFQEDTNGNTERLLRYLNRHLKEEAKKPQQKRRYATRTDMWDLLGVGKPLRKAEALALSLVNREYHFRFPDATGHGAVLFHRLDNLVGRESRVTSARQLVYNAMANQNRVTELDPEGVCSAYVEPVFEQMLKIANSTGFRPLAERIAPSGDQVAVVNEFQTDLERALESALPRPKRTPLPPTGEVAAKCAVWSMGGGLAGAIVGGVVACDPMTAAQAGGLGGGAVGLLGSYGACAWRNGKGRIWANLAGRKALRKLFAEYEHWER